MSYEPINPYAAPAPGYVPEGKPTKARPGWYTFYCVVAMILGSLGIMSGVVSIPGAILGQSMQPNFQPPPGQQQGVPPEFVDKMNEMQADIQAVTDRYFYITLVQQVLLIGVGTLLLVGAIQAMQMKRWGAKLLAIAFLLAAVFDLGRLVVTTLQMMEMWQVMEKSFGPMMEEAAKGGNQPPPPGFTDAMTMGMSVMFGAMVCMTVVWTLIKLVYYLSGWFYLQKPHVQARLQDA